MRDILVKKIVKFLGVLVSLTLLGCGSQNIFAKSEDIPPWEVSIAMPMYYPIQTLDVYGINKEEDWTIPLIGLQLASKNNSDFKYVRNQFSQQKYDGYGVLLADFVNGHAVQAGGTSVPPDSIYVKWVSLYDNTLYYTKIDLSKNVRKFMTHKNYIKGRKSPYYINSIVLGFLPNGNVKVWLYGYGKYFYIKEQGPEQKIKTKVPNKYDPGKYNNVIARLIDNANKENYKIVPVPWGKIEEVMIPKSCTMENFSDIDERLYK